MPDQDKPSSTAVTEQPDIPEFCSPFENIALAFSGGGFRAASYALGVLSYLNEIRYIDSKTHEENSLLKKVTYISSASGGSITSSLYALHTCSPDAQDFSVFFNKLYNCLRGNGLLQHALTILTTAKYWSERPQKSRNLINAFALAYDDLLFDKATLEDLTGSSTTHLEEVCFNATEFFRGVLFRQQVKMAADRPEEDFQYGNFIVSAKDDEAKKIKLGDLVAASSCFPVGFEPIIFPRDFTHPNLSKDDLQNALLIEPQTNSEEEIEFLKEPAFGLMDGGITDNQGLESMMKADKRRRNGKSGFRPFDLMLVNDVGSHFMDPYTVPPLRKKSLWRFLSIRRIVIALIGLALISTIAGYLAIRAGTTALAFIFWSVLLVCILLLLLLYATGRTINGFKSVFGKAIVRLLGVFLRKTGINFLLQMGQARMRSTVILNTEVFLKRIRYLLYETFYGTAEWKNRGKGNHVYDLSLTNAKHRNENPPPPHLEPSEWMQIVAENAYRMGTTLWFDQKDAGEKHSLECLIATGQFTTCFNLLEYISRLKSDTALYSSLSNKYKIRLIELESKMQFHFETFKDDPLYLLQKYAARADNFSQPHLEEIKRQVELQLKSR